MRFCDHSDRSHENIGSLPRAEPSRNRAGNAWRSSLIVTGQPRLSGWPVRSPAAARVASGLIRPLEAMQAERVPVIRPLDVARRVRGGTLECYRRVLEVTGSERRSQYNEEHQQ